jgi:hypothetical protein
MSTDRIKGKLINEGYVRDLIAEIKNRLELLEMLVECELDRRVKEVKREAVGGKGR